MTGSATGGGAELQPMYATIGRETPRGEGWSFEPKYDGVRVLAHVGPTGVRLVTRNGKEKTAQFPEVVEALRGLAAAGGPPLVLDGEVVALDRGKPARFQALQERVHLKDARAIQRQTGSAPAALIAFDILQDGGEWLTELPWMERRAALERRLGSAGSPGLRVSEVLRAAGEEALQRAQERGWEGVIAKRTDSQYRPGKRSDQWLKLKIEFRQEFVVGGWTEPQRSRKHLGSLLVGYFQDGQLRFAGGVGTGFNRESLRAVRERLDRLERKTPPFADPPATRTPAHWVRPEVVVEIRFSEWTADGRLRTPVFLGVREDKAAHDVIREDTSVQRASG